jgi:NADH:ubiquinone oxidoreductase subunit K
MQSKQAIYTANTAKAKLYIIKKKKYILLSALLMLQKKQIKVHISFPLVLNAILLAEILFGKLYKKIKNVLSLLQNKLCVQIILNLFNR